MTLRGFLALWDPAVPQRSAALRLAPPPGPTAGTLDQETWPRHRDPNRPSRNRDEVTPPQSGHQASASCSQQADSGGAGLSGKIKESRRRPLRHRTQRDFAGSEARHLGAVSKDRSPTVQGRRPHTGDPRLRSSRRLRAGNSPYRSSALGLKIENGECLARSVGTASTLRRVRLHVPPLGRLYEDLGLWRRGRDSNPRDGFPPTHFPGVRLRPLGHLSADPFSGTPNPVARGKTPIRQSPGQCPGLCHAQRGKSAVTCWDSSGRRRPAERSS